MIVVSFTLLGEWPWTSKLLNNTLKWTCKISGPWIVKLDHMCHGPCKLQFWSLNPTDRGLTGPHCNLVDHIFCWLPDTIPIICRILGRANNLIAPRPVIHIALIHYIIHTRPYTTYQYSLCGECYYRFCLHTLSYTQVHLTCDFFVIQGSVRFSVRDINQLCPKYLLFSTFVSFCCVCWPTLCDILTINSLWFEQFKTWLHTVTDVKLQIKLWLI